MPSASERELVAVPRVPPPLPPGAVDQLMTRVRGALPKQTPVYRARLAVLVSVPSDAPDPRDSHDLAFHRTGLWADLPDDARQLCDAVRREYRTRVASLDAHTQGVAVAFANQVLFARGLGDVTADERGWLCAPPGPRHTAVGTPRGKEAQRW